MVETERPAALGRARTGRGMQSGQGQLPLDTTASASLPQKPATSTPRTRRFRERARRGVLGVIPVEVSFDTARALVRAGLLPHAQLEDRAAIAEAVEKLLADVNGGGAHGSR